MEGRKGEDMKVPRFSTLYWNFHPCKAEVYGKVLALFCSWFHGGGDRWQLSSDGKVTLIKKLTLQESDK